MEAGRSKEGAELLLAEVAAALEGNVLLPLEELAGTRCGSTQRAFCLARKGAGCALQSWAQPIAESIPCNFNLINNASARTQAAAGARRRSRGGQQQRC